MHISKTRLTLAAAAVAALVLTPGRAHAQYLDPGAGSIMVQALIALAVGAAATLKFYWARISTFFNRRSQKRTTDAQ